MVKGVAMMAAQWAVEEMRTVDAGDARLNARLTEVLSQLGSRPTASIPSACGGWAETAAAYRVFANGKVDFDTVLQAHVDATRVRMAGESEVILVADTTEIDVTRPREQVSGTGPLGTPRRRGVLLHPLHGFTPDGTPLGTVHALWWRRSDEAAGSAKDRASKPIEAKESFRWLESLRQARQEADRAAQTHFTVVADSEADIYEWLAEAQAASDRLDWIVRACRDRVLRPSGGKTGENDGKDAWETRHLREAMLTWEALFTQPIQVRGREAKVSCETRGRRQPRRSRRAVVAVRAGRVRFRPPGRPDRVLPEVTVNVVVAQEVDPPADDVAVEWILLTSLPIDTEEGVRRVLASYCVRWMVEVLFRTIKTGCRVEKRRFESLEHLLPCLAIYLIVAWRTLYVCRLGRAFPEISCEAIFEPAEWKSVCRVVRRQTPPKQAPTLHEMVLMVAQLGGYVDRKRGAEPGPQTIWIGLQRTHDLALCWTLFGPEAPPAAKTAPGDV